MDPRLLIIKRDQNFILHIPIHNEFIRMGKYLLLPKPLLIPHRYELAILRFLNPTSVQIEGSHIATLNAGFDLTGTSRNVQIHKSYSQ